MKSWHCPGAVRDRLTCPKLKLKLFVYLASRNVWAFIWGSSVVQLMELKLNLKVQLRAFSTHADKP